MKLNLKPTFLFAIAVMLCVSVFAQDGTLYGKKFDSKKAITTSELKKNMGNKEEMSVVIEGEIAEVCQVAGCWITLKNEAGDNVFVKIKEHQFEIPKDMAGRKAYVAGTAITKTVTVDELRHYAEDAGKSAEEIERITEPKTEVRVNATGIIIE